MTLFINFYRKLELILRKPLSIYSTLITHNLTWTKTPFVLYHSLYGNFCNHLSTLVLLFFTVPILFILQCILHVDECVYQCILLILWFFWHLLAFALYNVVALLFLCIVQLINAWNMCLLLNLCYFTHSKHLNNVPKLGMSLIK